MVADSMASNIRVYSRVSVFFLRDTKKMGVRGRMQYFYFIGEVRSFRRATGADTRMQAHCALFDGWLFHADIDEQL